MPPYSAFFFHGMQPHAGHSYNSRTPIFENMNLFAEAIHSRKCAEEEREEKVPITPGEFRFKICAISLYWWCLISCGVIHQTALLFIYHMIQHIWHHA